MIKRKTFVEVMKKTATITCHHLGDGYTQVIEERAYVLVRPIQCRYKVKSDAHKHLGTCSGSQVQSQKQSPLKLQVLRHLVLAETLAA